MIRREATIRTTIECLQFFCWWQLWKACHEGSRERADVHTKKLYDIQETMFKKDVINCPIRVRLEGKGCDEREYDTDYNVNLSYTKGSEWTC